MIVADDDDFRAGRVECLPQWSCGAVISVRTRTEEWMVPVRERTPRSAIRQFIAQPLTLGRVRVHRDIAVQRKDLPVAFAIGVVTEPRRSRALSKIIKVGNRARRVVVMIAGRGPGSRLVTAPGRVITIQKITDRSGGVGVVACREDRSLQTVEQFGRCFGAL